MNPPPPVRTGDPEKSEVGSWALISGAWHRGGKAIGGGFGEGANVSRFSPPATILVGSVEVVEGARAFGPPAASWASFSPVDAQMFPPPAWHPKGVALLKVLSSACPMTMSPTERSSGERARRSLSELSLASVNGPSDPPLIVHVPGVRGGMSTEPRILTFGLFGKLVLPCRIGCCS